MPGRDGTGPYGMGARSGRGFGNCKGYPAKTAFGYRCGVGFGRGYRWMRYGYPVAPQVPDANDEKEFLQEQVKYLENHLEVLKNQLKAFEE